MVKPFNELRICIIYKITIIGSDDFYIGSTTSRLSTRKSQHKFAFNNGNQWPLYNWIRENSDWGNISMTEIHRESVNNQKEQLALEQKWMDELNPTINHAAAQNTPEELKRKKKAYYEANKEHLTAKKKEYYEANKEHLTAKKKEWLEANLESRRAYEKKWRDENAESQKAYKRAWYLANKAKYAAKSKARYESQKAAKLAAMKVNVTCECGKTMRKGSLARHKKKSCKAIS